MSKNFFGTKVFLHHRGAVQVKQQQFSLDILILNAGSEVNQIADGFVTIVLKGSAVAPLQDASQSFRWNSPVWVIWGRMRKPPWLA